ncbi:membrane protein [Gordonia phage Survivors]|nr:membrane protein [Gordonia phage Survivors]
MFTAASVPMWVAIIALVGTIASPIIQGRMNKNSPTTRADAAEKFTRIAEGVADDYEEVRDELRELKPLLRELILCLDTLVPHCEAMDDDHRHRLRELIDNIRKRMY